MQFREKPLGPRHLFANDRLSVDSSVFYVGLIKTLLDEDARVIDVGCGRGSYADDPDALGDMFDFRGADRTVLGLDIDGAGGQNPFIDEFRRLDRDVWPVPDSWADLIVSDWTLEHVQDPAVFAREVTRVLRVGGAFVARTVNRYSGLAFAARAVPNRSHSRVLRYAQPTRPEGDIFPTAYRMNSRRALRGLLGANYQFSIAGRPGIENYLMARHPVAARVALAAERRLPENLQTCLILSARLQSK